MEYYTLQDFMVHSKGITYIVVVIALVGLAFFWKFLSGRDEE